jgi:vacuolar iron transporter family protein
VLVQSAACYSLSSELKRKVLKMPIAMQPESHKSEHIGWLRAAVLGANDGIVSTASLIVGVAAANATHQNILVTGVAGLVAGAMSMAAGEYVSVSSQADTENADLAREKEELAQIYVGRGLETQLATQVAEQLMAHDALGSHARDELGITEELSAKPIQAAVASAAAFSVGAALPLLMIFIFSAPHLILAVSTASLLFLILLGLVAAKVGGAPLVKGALRVGFWGALAMAITAGIGSLFGAVA